MFKTTFTLALAVVASAYLLAADARAQSIELNEPVAICSDAGRCRIINPPSQWAWGGSVYVYFKVDGLPQAVNCAAPQATLLWNGWRWDRIFAARNTVARAINEHVCATAAQLNRTTH